MAVKARPAVTRSQAQSARALVEANRVRGVRSRLKRRIHAGEEDWRDVLDDDDVATMKLADLLNAVRLIGPLKVRAFLAAHRIARDATVGALTRAQRYELVDDDLAHPHHRPKADAMTENTPATTETPAAVVHPGTGEVLELRTAAPIDLADVLDAVADVVGHLRDVERAVTDELARRLDAVGRRKATLGGVDLETNAPTEDLYDVNALWAALGRLAAEGRISPELIDELIVAPAPKPPAPRVDKRRAAAILRSNDRELVAAIESARTRVPTRRTVKVLERARDTTAEATS